MITIQLMAIYKNVFLQIELYDYLSRGTGDSALIVGQKSIVACLGDIAIFSMQTCYI